MALTDEVVRQRAKNFAGCYKGKPWSETEYSVYLYQERQGLLRDGATPEQMEMFIQIVREAPTKGGRFNSWSGD